jgi:hypothetical protein
MSAAMTVSLRDRRTRYDRDISLRGVRLPAPRYSGDVADSEASFTALAAPLLREPDVSEGTGFGSNAGLRVSGRIFAFLSRGALVVKLPAERCSEMVGAGAAEPFETGGRRMREWVSVPASAAEEWPALAGEALAFVRRG